MQDTQTRCESDLGCVTGLGKACGGMAGAWPLESKAWGLRPRVKPSPYQMGVLLPDLDIFTKVGEIYCQTEVSMLAFNSVVPVPFKDPGAHETALPPFLQGLWPSIL